MPKIPGSENTRRRKYPVPKIPDAEKTRFRKYPTPKIPGSEKSTIFVRSFSGNMYGKYFTVIVDITLLTRTWSRKKKKK